MSPPTAAALAELSIEEISKAWLLYFVWLFGTGREPRRGSIKFTEKEESALEGFFKQNRRYLEGLGNELSLAFKDHPPKLKFLRFLFDYIELLTPILQKKKEYVAQLSETALGPVFNARRLMAGATPQSTPSVFEGFKRRGLTELARLKNRALYVDLSRSNELISPEVNLPVVPLLQMLAARLIVALKVELLSLTS